MSQTSLSETDLASINLASSDAAARQALIDLRFETESGTIVLSGIDALLRILVDQLRSDFHSGLSTSALLTGYRGSPVGGVDIAYKRAKDKLLNKGVHFLNSVNEELAATSIWGSQLATTMSDPLVDGVLGMWYGKMPGLDRSGDAIRHANMSGTDPKGGVLCVTGDDPECKSSTVPSVSEGALSDLGLPVLFPGSVQEVVDFGRFGYGLSRASGLWVGLKIVTDIADAYASVEVGPHRMVFSENRYQINGELWQHNRADNLLPPESNKVEQEFFQHRLEAAKFFIQENSLDKISGATQDAWLGIVCPGTNYYDAIEALSALGIEASDLSAKGIRIYKPGVIWPLNKDSVLKFAKGLEQILVLHEKSDLVSSQLHEILYSQSQKPQILFRHDAEGKPLIEKWGSINVERLLEPMARVLSQKLDIAFSPQKALDQNLPPRVPYYCSGCPHNRSTVVPEGSVAGGGIGCHTMSLIIPSRQAEGMTQMGGEGAQWVGAAPFVKTPHRFQNIGDGTLAHSGSLAIRQAVAAGTNITYKILYNDAVAMTGGQEAAGDMPVPQLTQMLIAEGVQRVVVVADDVNKYPRKAEWGTGVDIKDRSELEAVQKELRQVPGVSILIYDQACSAELRRRRKKGQIPEPEERVFINQEVCEACGDCSRASNCLSLFQVETDLGPKIQIHQESCNIDLTCMEGNCPSFVTVKAPKLKRTRNPLLKKLEDNITEPKKRVQEANLLSVGIGGTGVLTVNQILATAAFLDGKYVSALDQTGLSQKGGTVTSHLKISNSPITASNRLRSGQADLIMMFDILAGAPHLDKASPDKTVVVGSTTKFPTGEMIADRSIEFPTDQEFHERIQSLTKKDSNFWIDAERVINQVFKSQPTANVVILGCAYQKGLIPANSESILKAIKLNGVSVAENLKAFQLGRKMVADPDYMEKLLNNKSQPVIFKSEKLEDILAHREKQLIKYQNRSYARSYVGFVKSIRAKEEELSGELAKRDDLSKTVARQLYKLMAYKDEYEVARLYASRTFKRQVVKTFGKGTSLTYHLQPPTFSKLGLNHKIHISSKLARPAFRILKWLKPLRGTFLDPFGKSRERKLERRLPEEYKELIQKLMVELSPTTYNKITEIAELADVIRGYDTVKLKGVAEYRAQLTEKLIELSNLEKEAVEVA